MMYSRKADRNKAIEDFTDAIALDPQNALAYAERSLEWFRLFKDEEAVADINAAIWLEPESTRGYYLRGHFALNTKNYAEAVADASLAIHQSPETATYWNLRANAYRQLHQEAEARADFEKTLQLDPTYLDARKNLSWQYATCEDARFRDGALALEHARIACEQTKWKDVSCLKGLAAAYAELGDFAKAIEMQRRAMADVDDTRRVHYQAKLDQLLRHEPIREDPIATMAVGAGKRW